MFSEETFSVKCKVCIVPKVLTDVDIHAIFESLINVTVFVKCHSENVIAHANLANTFFKSTKVNRMSKGLSYWFRILKIPI